MGIQNLTGYSLGQYELRELLGVGGMGAVYRAYQASLKRAVAVKVLTPQLAPQSDYVERFTHEAETVAALEHAHIVPVYDYGTQQGISYVVMRLLTGGSLAQRLEQHKALPSLTEVGHLLRQLAGALDYAHSQGVIHRDIKSSNIMFDTHGSAYLVDFGIAKLLGSTASLTGSGVAMGTPVYMAPEQWRAETVTPATDEYALAVVTYQLLTGQVPFDAPTPYGMMHKHLYETPAPLHDVRPDLPPALTSVLQRALAKQADARYPSITTLVDAFESAVGTRRDPATNFFTTPISLEPAAPFVGTTPQAQSSPALATPKRITRPARLISRRPLLYGLGTLGVVLILALGLVIALLAGRGSSDQRETGALSRGQFPWLTQSLSPVTATATLRIIAILPSDTPSVAPTLTSTPTLPPTLAATPTNTLPPTDTPDLGATADALLAARLTQTAAQWTDTPTPDVGATIAAALAGTAASWTDTPTFTFTPTNTFSPTPTHSPTSTDTPTPSPTGTDTSSPSPTFSATWTATPLPIATPVPSSTPLAPSIPAGCERFLPPRLTAGGQGCVIDTEPNHLRDYPESLNEIGEIPPGGVFMVLEGPECTLGTVTVWWYVEYGDVTGWTAEGSRRTNTYWLSPLPCPVATRPPSVVPPLNGTVLEITREGGQLNARSAPSTAADVLDKLYWGDRVLWQGNRVQGDGYNWYEVVLYDGRRAYMVDDPRWVIQRDPAQMTPGIQVGVTVRVTLDGDEMHLRSRAGMASSEVKTLRQDEQLAVISGPQYGDYYVWWQLQLSDGRTGWAVDVPGWWVVVQ